MKSKQNGKPKNDILRLLFLGISFLFAGTVALLIPQEKIELIIKINNSIMPVLFGFMITTIAIVGSLDTSYKALTADVLQQYKNIYTGKMLRLIYIGSCYGISLILGITLVIMNIQHPTNIDLDATQKIIQETVLLEKFFVFVASLSAFLSLSFPYTIYKLHLGRYQFILDAKRLTEEKEQKGKMLQRERELYKQ